MGKARKLSHFEKIYNILKQNGHAMNTRQILDALGTKYNEYPAENGFRVVLAGFVKEGRLAVAEHTTCAHCFAPSYYYSLTDQGRIFMNQRNPEGLNWGHYNA